MRKSQKWEGSLAARSQLSLSPAAEPHWFIVWMGDFSARLSAKNVELLLRARASTEISTARVFKVFVLDSHRELCIYRGGEEESCLELVAWSICSELPRLSLCVYVCSAVYRYITRKKFRRKRRRQVREKFFRRSVYSGSIAKFKL